MRMDGTIFDQRRLRFLYALFSLMSGGDKGIVKCLSLIIKDLMGSIQIVLRNDKSYIWVARYKLGNATSRLRFNVVV